MADEKKQGVGDLLMGIVSIIEDADPTALSTEVKAKVALYSQLVGAGVDQALLAANVSDVVPVIIDSSSKILEQVDVIWDAISASKAAKATETTASTATPSAATPASAQTSSAATMLAGGSLKAGS